MFPLKKFARKGLIKLILIKIENFSFTKMHLNISSAKRRSFCPGGGGGGGGELTV